MKLSRIDIIGQNGNDGLHYEGPDILDRLRATTKINGAYPKDIEDAIAEIEALRSFKERALNVVRQMYEAFWGTSESGGQDEVNDAAKAFLDEYND